MRKRRLSRLLTVLLSVGLLVQNMPLAVLADTLLTTTEDSAAKDETADADPAEATETQNTNIVFDTDEFSDALIQAAEEKTIVKKTYSFTGYVAEDYEQLFDIDYEDLYELRALERKEGDLTVRVFARLDEDGFATDDEAFAEFDDADETDLSEATMSVATEEDSDAYMITGNEQIIFLLLNNTVSPKSTHIEIDGRVSPEIKILTAKQIKKQLSDDDDDDDEASTPDTNADSSDAVDHPSDGDGTTPTTGDATSVTGDTASTAVAAAANVGDTAPATLESTNAVTTAVADGTTSTVDTVITTGDGSTGTDGTPTTTDATSGTGDTTPATGGTTSTDGTAVTTGTGDATTPAGDTPLDPSQPNPVDPSLVPPADLAQATPNEIPKPGTAGMLDPEKQEENGEATLLGDLYESVLF